MRGRSQPSPQQKIHQKLLQKNELQPKEKGIFLLSSTMWLSKYLGAQLFHMAATFGLLQFVGTLSARQGYWPGSDAPSHAALLGRACIENDSNSCAVRGGMGPTQARRRMSAFKDPLKPNFKYSGRGCALLGEKILTGKSCLQGSGQGKPFKAKAWGNTES